MRKTLITASFGLSLLLGSWLLYFTPRTDFAQLLSLYVALFVLYAIQIWFFKREEAGGAVGTAAANDPSSSPSNFGEDSRRRPAEFIHLAIAFGFVLRLALCFRLPNLSDDYFRFFWDGLLVVEGVNPYVYLPRALPGSELILPATLDAELLGQLNSPDYFSVYPPICQWVFASGAWLFPDDLLGAVVVMKGWILLAECGSLFFLIKLVRRWQQPLWSVLLYWLNPLVIVELTGNLHFEAWMIVGTLGAVYLLDRAMSRNKTDQEDAEPGQVNWLLFFASAGLFAVGIGAKLLPLMFLPFFLRKLGLVRATIYIGSVGSVLVMLFLPFYDPQLVENIGSSLGLYFARFEFNASVYYLARWVGIQLTGWNQISTIGPLLSGGVLLFILIRAIGVRLSTIQKLFAQFAPALFVYLLLATTVHPWYVCPLVAFSVFSRSMPAAQLWSLTVVLSYATYQTTDYIELNWPLLLEYGIVFGMLSWLVYASRKRFVLKEIKR